MSNVAKTLCGLLLLGIPARIDVCEECRADKLCKPHAEREEAEIERLGPELRSQESRERVQALVEIAELTFEHENARSKGVANVLVAALEDPSLRVRKRAIRLLVPKQHAETAVVAVVSLLEGFKKNMWSLVPWLTGRNEERGNAMDAMNYIEAVMRVSGDMPDDRIVEALSDLLLALPSEMRGQPVAMAATRSLLELGTRDAVQAVMRQFSSMSEGREMRNIHNALDGFASRLGVEDAPQFDEDAPEHWKRWLKRHGRRLPTKLGKWKGTE